MWLTMSDDSVEEVIEEVAVGTIVRGLERFSRTAGVASGTATDWQRC